MTWMALGMGLIALVVGGDLLVRGASRIGLRMGMSPMMVGMTIVGAGTSAPELAASLDAAFRGSPAIVLGAIVGSNIANVALILGLSAMAAPIAVSAGFARREALLLVGAAVALTVVAWDGGLSRLEAALLLVALPAALKLSSGSDEAEGDPGAEDPGPLWPSLVRVAAGLVALPIGAHWFVGGAVTLAHGLGIDEHIVGLTVVAVGTSLPELASSLAAARRGMGSMVLGNVIGSNLFNVFGILGLTGLLRPLEAHGAHRMDLLAGVGVSVLAAVLMVSGRRLTRPEGAVLVAGYAAFTVAAFAG